MTDTIPEAVIEAMLAEGPGDPYLDQWVLSKMLAAAERAGWRLCPEEITLAMADAGEAHADYGDSETGWGSIDPWPIWHAMWNAAPKVRG